MLLPVYSVLIFISLGAAGLLEHARHWAIGSAFKPKVPPTFLSASSFLSLAMIPTSNHFIFFLIMLLPSFLFLFEIYCCIVAVMEVTS
jgi:hypothetical protein